MDLGALPARMTLDAKLAQLGCVWCNELVRATIELTDPEREIKRNARVPTKVEISA